MCLFCEVPNYTFDMFVRLSVCDIDINKHTFYIKKSQHFNLKKVKVIY